LPIGKSEAERYPACVRHFDPGLPIRVTADEKGRPVTFLLNGHIHHTESIEDVREPKLDRRSVTGLLHRVYFVVVTNDGLMCEIFRDVVGGQGREPGSWWMARLWD
jgi:hypothetical protein